MIVKDEVFRDDSEPFFPFGEMPGMITLFTDTNYEDLDDLMDQMTAHNVVPLVQIDDREHPLCKHALRVNDDDFGRRFKSLIIPIRYTKVFKA